MSDSLYDNGETGHTGGERLHQHMVRLHAVAELGVIGEPPAEQARRILADSSGALDFDYAEVGEAGPGDEYARLCAVGKGAEDVPYGIGARGIRSEKPRIVFDTRTDELRTDHAVAAIGLRSVLYWPFTAHDKRCLLTLGWTQPRNEFVNDEEMRYIEFLVALVSRSLEVLEGHRRMAERAETDQLTGIPNRAAIFERLNMAISAAQREETRVAVLYIDLNDFKRLNDTHGHAVGDAALRAMALRVQSVLRRHEACGRYGGDEFCVVVSSFKDDDELAIIARRILGALSEPVVHEALTLSTSASIGIAVYPRDGAGANELLVRADRAMYRAKRERGPAFAFCTDGEPTMVDGPLRVDAATFNTQFMLCFQPIVAARGGRPIAAEVLPRWLHPQGMRSPEVFLRAARDQGVTRELDALIVRAAFQKATELRRVADIVYHVNLSEPGEGIIDALPRDAVALALEVSEAQVAAEPYRYIAFAAACRARGLRFGVADFGSYGLSLRVLAELRPDFVKVRASVEEGQRGSLAVLIDQAHQLSCPVIGECVETPAEHQWLVASGADAVQGFEISSPLAEQDFFTWLRRYRSAAAR